MSDRMRIQVLRNSTVCNNQDDAQTIIEGLSDDTTIYDGEVMLARYYTDSHKDNVGVLLGVQTKKDNNGNYNISYVALDNGQMIRDVKEFCSTGRFCLDFSDKANTIQMCNMTDKTMKIVKVNKYNVNSLKITTLPSFIKENVVDEPDNIVILPNNLMTWDIERTNDDEIASVGIMYKLI